VPHFKHSNENVTPESRGSVSEVIPVLRRVPEKGHCGMDEKLLAVFLNVDERNNVDIILDVMENGVPHFKHSNENVTPESRGSVSEVIPVLRRVPEKGHCGMEEKLLAVFLNVDTRNNVDVIFDVKKNRFPHLKLDHENTTPKIRQLASEVMLGQSEGCYKCNNNIAITLNANLKDSVEATLTVLEEESVSSHVSTPARKKHHLPESLSKEVLSPDSRGLAGKKLKVNNVEVSVVCTEVSSGKPSNEVELGECEALSLVLAGLKVSSSATNSATPSPVDLGVSSSGSGNLSKAELKVKRGKACKPSRRERKMEEIVGAKRIPKVSSNRAIKVERMTSGPHKKAPIARVLLLVCAAVGGCVLRRRMKGQIRTSSDFDLIRVTSSQHKAVCEANISKTLATEDT